MEKKIKVLIFDDNEELLELCTIILEELGCIIKTTATSDDADKQVLEFMPDIIFMDNWLPNLSGIEATRLIKKNSLVNKIPVIYFSANDKIQDLARKAGADDHLAKPFDISAMEEMVFKHVQHKNGGPVVSVKT